MIAALTQQDDPITVKMLMFSRKCVASGSFDKYHAERLRRLGARIIEGNYI